jgi:hypothetical protein
MTSTLQVFRTVAVASVALLYATSAAPQTAPPQGHDHGEPASTIRSQGAVAAPSVREQIAALDSRIEMLAADMRMLSGEMKVDVMASLLSSLLERQALMEAGKKSMGEAMRRRMMERREPPAASFGQEPGGMCAPEN